MRQLRCLVRICLLVYGIRVDRLLSPGLSHRPGFRLSEHARLIVLHNIVNIIVLFMIIFLFGFKVLYEVRPVEQLSSDCVEELQRDRNYERHNTHTYKEHALIVVAEVWRAPLAFVCILLVNESSNQREKSQCRILEYTHYTKRSPNHSRFDHNRH